VSDSNLKYGNKEPRLKNSIASITITIGSALITLNNKGIVILKFLRLLL
jgi:hypothetical protein